MTIFDLRIMNMYRAEHPSIEDLAAIIGVGLGVYKPPRVREAEIAEESLPADPRDDIRKAFAGTKVPELGSMTGVI